MYEVINLIVHVIVVALIFAAFYFREKICDVDELTLQKIALVVALSIWGGWAVLIGAAHNLKSLFWLF